MQNTLTDFTLNKATGLISLSISDEEFTLFRDLIYKECGISLSKEKKLFLESRLKRRMEELGIHTVGEYFYLVSSSKNRLNELPVLFDVLTIGETSFFRNKPQFDLFTDVVLPELIAKKEKSSSKILRIWSAGCSTGQEPYSLAMTLLEAIPESDSMMSRVFASDLSFTALERAQLGFYKTEQVKCVEPDLLAKYFNPINDGYQIKEAVKKRVIFDYHNLKNDNGLRNLDVIFCRNVMIYFDAEEQKRLINRFVNCLVPGGYLFVGHAESLQGLSNKFSMFHKNRGIAYKLEV
ncbi:MAG: protein-glutamate O-methyltransferase CheR [Acidobacteriota bacterium]